MGSGFSKQKKQFQEMQKQLLQAQEDMKSLETWGESGGGLVKVCLNGEGEIKTLKIKKECVDPEDVEGLEDLIVAAFKQASEKLKEASSQHIPNKDILSSLGINF